MPNGSPNENGGTRTGSGGGSTTTTTQVISRLVRFTVNPLTRQITLSLLN
ncbi:MAG: hypothetical protein ABIU09_09470 [Pyrinomonadaceae bacterium]